MRDERLGTALEKFKEQHETLLEVFRDSLVLATADLQEGDIGTYWKPKSRAKKRSPKPQ